MSNIINIAGYKQFTSIYDGENSHVYRAIREKDGLSVILKILKANYPTPEQLKRYKQEYRLTHSLELPQIIKAYELKKYQKTLAIVLEDIGGISLKQWLTQYPQGLPIDLFLLIAIKITEALGKLHSENVIHKDINSANIVINPETMELKLIDLGISTQLTRENPSLASPNILEGTIAYISPEQTGRMNRILDYRTDFYSLGVTFYELLTGKLPFISDDSLEVIYCHIAQKPPAIANSRKIANVIVNIVMKLMAKNAEDRYQSAWGIQADLEDCLQQWQETGQISAFTLGKNDLSDRFEIPQKLYGREKEIHGLIECFERMANVNNQENQSSELVLVTGYSGIGKTALVTSLYQPITKKRGYFISGKFDQFQGNIPYSALINAFIGLIKQLLTESEITLQKWREKLLKNLGNNGQVITDVIPDLELIIGKQPSIPDLGGIENQNRFNLVFQRFINTFCCAEHPLILFLDDMQWADFATLNLIELLLKTNQVQYLLIIFSYRDNEVSNTHPLTFTINNLQSSKVNLKKFFLAPLSLNHIETLIAETLNLNVIEVKSLAKLIFQKTQGNPFFTNQFLQTLYNENLLTYNQDQKRWQWDIEEIDNISFTDNVLDLMSKNLKKLPLALQKNLAIASFIGTIFDLNSISLIQKKTPKEIFEQLQLAINDKFITPQSSMDENLLIQDYKFVHDRIQQAAYGLIPDEKKNKTHLNIGQFLLQNLSQEKIEEKLFDIVNHLNFAKTLITESSEKDSLAQFNLQAGIKAKKAAAYKTAKNYLETGIELLRVDCWENQYDLTLNFYDNLTEVLYLNGFLEQTELLATLVLKNANTVLDKINIYKILIAMKTNQNDLIGAINLGRNVLKQLDINLPVKSDPVNTKLFLEKISNQLENKEINDLINLPVMSDLKAKASIEILERIFSSVFQAIPELLTILSSLMVSLSIKWGNAPASAVGYIIHGTVLCAFFGDVQNGYQFGLLSISVIEKLKGLKFKSLVLQIFGTCIQPYQDALKLTLPILKQSYEMSLEAGDFLTGGYTIHCWNFNAFFAGRKLTILQNEIKDHLSLLKQLNQYSAEMYLNITAQVIHNFREPLIEPHCLQGDLYNELVFFPKHLEQKELAALTQAYIYKLILAYTFEDYESALNYVQEASSYVMGVSGTVFYPIYHFYAALTYFQNSDNSILILEQIENHYKIINQFAQNAPMNYQHKLDLLEAEKYRFLGNKAEAIEFYDRAIQGAKANEYIQEEALANELAAKFYLDWGKEVIAQYYLQEAHYCYLHWGANAKVKQLEENYPQLLNKQEKSSNNITTESSNGINCDNLDLAAMLKVSNAISSEINLDNLLKILMKTLLENAAAQRGCLLLTNANLDTSKNLSIAIYRQEDKTNLFPNQSLSQLLPEMVVSYVERTHENVVIENASLSSQFSKDVYIQSEKPLSILCYPLLNQGQLMGIVYLENRMTVGAFTRNHIDFLQLISGQTAIAINNARLYRELKDSYATLEQRVKERTSELAKSNSQLEIAKEKAEVANQAKSSFLANMSHELRTPLNAILGFSQIMMRSSNLPEDDRDNMRIISTSGDYLLTLINHVLDLSKIESGRMSLNPTKFDLYSLLQEVQDLLTLKAEDKKLQLLFDYHDDLPQYVYTDETKLRQVLINLINNGIKFTSEGGVNVEIKNKEIFTSKSSKTNHSLRFAVTDTGFGIAEDEIDKLFEAFAQTQAGKQSHEGTGLGLPISKKFIELMGGDIRVESQLGVGTTFRFEIKVDIVDGVAVEKKKEGKNIIALQPNQPRYRILVADDRPSNRLLLVKLLQPLGFELQEASNGKEAIKIWDEWEPHLIWMDMRMPVMNGYEATQYIKGTTKGNATAIIALTASVLEEEKSVILSSGCDDFVRKPFKESVIFETMNKHLGVEYTYNEEPPVVNDKLPDLTPDDFKVMPQEWLEKVHYAAKILDDDVILELLTEIPENNSLLAEKLTQLVNDCELEKIKKLIESIL